MRRGAGSAWSGPRRTPQPDHDVVPASDPWAVAAVGVLVLLGVVNLIALGEEWLALRQLVAVLIGLGLLVVLPRLRVRSLPALGWGAYSLAVGSLLAVPFIGLTVQGARRWIDLGAFTVQPSELSKLALLIVLAHLLAPGYTWRRFVAALAVAAVPIAMTALQPDLSTTILLVALTGLMLVLARVRLWLLLALGLAAVALLPLAEHLLRPYQQARLEAFLSGSRDAGGPGWAMLQAEIAVAQGGMVGQSGEPLHDLRAEYLPARQHDLAFASLVEGWGLVAGVAAALAALVLVWRVALASRRARSREAALVAAGFATLFGVEAMLSVAGNLALVPLAGIPFPLLSYGGTAAAAHLAALGLVFGASRDALRRPLWAPPRRLRRHPRLIRFAALLVSVDLAGMSLVVWHLQTARGDDLRRLGEQQMLRCFRLPAPRGILTDRHGTPLVTNAAENRVYVVPGLFREDASSVDRLAALTGQSPAALRRTLSRPGPDLQVAVATVPPVVGKRIEAAGQPGVLVAPSQRRVYPHGPMLAPMLGFVGVATPADMQRWPDLPLGAIVGRAGLERQYDAILRGSDGVQCVYVDPPGLPVALARSAEPVRGADVRLNLDLRLQRRATDALSAALRLSRGDLGGAVVMDARSGAVLAMASLPSYDNNVYGPPVDADALRDAMRGRGMPMFDHASQVAAPPGSTFKLVAAAANVAYDAIPVGRVIPTGGSFTLGDATFLNWRPMPPHNFTQAIAWSNNVYFYKLAWRLGPNRLTNVAAQLGVGRPTGIDLPGESPGFLGTPTSIEQAGGTWYAGSTVILGIGQGYVLATPLQVARWTAGITTGRLITPHLGHAFGSAPGSFAALTAPRPQRLSFARELGPVRSGMRAAVTGGTAAKLRDLAVPAGGKTGSSEDPASPNGRPDSWFTAVAPIDNPEVVVTVFVRGGGFGSMTSGPVAKAILDHYYAHRAAILATSGRR
jgi:cell division protein FtsI/penicillin-binding protein 2/cell division protein FtsW (lipid II flippase)